MKELKINDDWVYNNEEEAEMGQLHAIHNNMNAVADVRRRLEAQAALPSEEFCQGCGEEIPQLRRQAVPGVQFCIYCQEKHERR